jgi:hypothetical protein
MSRLVQVMTYCQRQLAAPSDAQQSLVINAPVGAKAFYGVNVGFRYWTKSNKVNTYQTTYMFRDLFCLQDGHKSPSANWVDLDPRELKALPYGSDFGSLNSQIPLGDCQMWNLARLGEDWAGGVVFYWRCQYNNTSFGYTLVTEATYEVEDVV